MNLKLVPTLLAVSLAFGGQGVSGQTIVDIAAGDPNSFSTLVDLLEATNLVGTLADENAEFTVFAPTNDAFEKLSPEVLTYLGNNPDVLANVLLYHVVPGEIFSDVINGGSTATTVLGADIKFSFHWYWSHAHHWWRHGLFLNRDARVVTADVDASNGVVHVINEVLIPPHGFAQTPNRDDSTTILGAAQGTNALSTLAEVVGSANLAETLDGPGPFTVFAPVDDAFGALDPSTLEDLLNDPTGALSNVLLFHVASKELSAADIILSGAKGVRMVNKDIVGFKFDGTTLTLTDSTDEVATVIQADIFLNNGVVHLIDKVLIPPVGCPYKHRIWCWLYW